MEKENFWASKEWLAFEKAARERDFDPVELLFDFLRESIEVWEDEELHEAIRQDVLAYADKHGLTEDDAVEIVRQYRREKQARVEAEQEREELHATA